MDKQTISVQVPTTEAIAQRRSLIPTFFGLAILFFFFTFCEFSCQGQKFAAVSGINLVTGTSIEKPSTPSLFGGGADTEREEQKMPANFWAILAFAAAALGLGIFLMKHAKEAMIGAISGGVGAGSLFLLQTTLSAAVKRETNGMVVLDFQLAYWGALLLLLAAGAISYLRMKQRATDYQAPPTMAEQEPVVQID